MKLLTTTQKQWLIRKKIKVGSFYSFPPNGFHIYDAPWGNVEYMDTNIFNRSLQGQYFLVKAKTKDFCKGNFYNRPKGADWYMSEDELSLRPIFEIFFLWLICFLPMAIYNRYKGGVYKIESANQKTIDLQ